MDESCPRACGCCGERVEAPLRRRSLSSSKCRRSRRLLRESKHRIAACSGAGTSRCRKSTQNGHLDVLRCSEMPGFPEFRACHCTPQTTCPSAGSGRASIIGVNPKPRALKSLRDLLCSSNPSRLTPTGPFRGIPTPASPTSGGSAASISSKSR